MADTRPTAVTPLRACHLSVLGIFAPARLMKEQEADNDARKQFTDAPPPEPTAFVLRRAVWSSLVAVLLSAGAGYGTGWIVIRLIGCVGPSVITILQLVGAALLLWGTLFVRGWEVQTFSGVTLVERVNRWLFVSMYCAGTAILVCSIPLVACARP